MRAEEYETITVGAGEKWTYSLSDGETFENYLIDITADGANAHIDATATNWTIRNVGFKGAGTRNSSSRNYHIGCVDSGNGTSVIENVYLGDGDDGTSHKDGFASIFVYPSHSGTIEMRNVYIEGYTDNGLYASEPGHDTAVNGQGGEIHVYDSYSGNNTAANFRLGSDGSKLVNCCSWGGPHRGFWMYFEHGQIIDSHIGGMDNPERAITVGGSGSTYDKMRYAEVTVENTCFEGVELRSSTTEIHGTSAGKPERFVPEGCPTSAEQAASGAGTDGTTGSTGDSSEDSDGSHLLAFVTSSDAYNDTYSFAVDGDVERTAAPYESPSGYPIEGGANDTIDVEDGTSYVEGLTGNGFGDAFRIDGAVTSITIDNPDVMWVELDGEALSPDEVIEATGGDTGLERTLLIDGVGTTGESRYEFDVTGDVEATTYRAASIDDDIQVDDDHVSGAVTGWRDAFAFDGELENVTVEGDARVLVDGEEIDTDDFGDALPRVLTLVGNGSPATYEVTVDGIIEPAVWDDIDDVVTVDSGTVEGSIERDVQRFRFSGSVTDLRFDAGSAHVYADQDRIVPDDFN
ncbi:hypothetical protein ACFO5R_08410 [Halosolutus amylolyticus]|uniref:Right handed beta helix region n=1 Tax=Halosolutus amylolyticus TaxID=2932267 RepID=A0ABD5PPY7_9EURY|nr:hypothetical protein [Halosolutus amylolyticus]